MINLAPDARRPAPADRQPRPAARQPGPLEQLRAGRLTRRLPQLYAGLVLYGFTLACLIRAHLGNAPWDVLHQGIADHERGRQVASQTLEATRDIHRVANDGERHAVRAADVADYDRTVIEPDPDHEPGLFAQAAFGFH